ncbi:MAG: hypothetical protein HDR28_09375 [Lachnospiraceae bacterium]|nr:hypothetical protein [Lachnospiraceae bacterium]
MIEILRHLYIKYKKQCNLENYILSDERKKRAQESKILLSQIQVMFEEDKGWEDEDSMLADMAAFRRERIGL